MSLLLLVCVRGLWARSLALMHPTPPLSNAADPHTLLAVDNVRGDRSGARFGSASDAAGSDAGSDVAEARVRRHPFPRASFAHQALRSCLCYTYRLCVGR